VRCNPRLFADQGTVGVDRLPAGGTDIGNRTPEQVERRCALPFRFCRREERPDVAQPRSSEQRVDQRMGDDVAVGVAREPTGRLELDSPENERNSVRKCVRIDAEPNAELAYPSRSCRRDRRSKTVTVS
jgi:hypothetical protein